MARRGEMGDLDSVLGSDTGAGAGDGSICGRSGGFSLILPNDDKEESDEEESCCWTRRASSVRSAADVVDDAFDDVMDMLLGTAY